jgi:hypothetical protein
MTDSTLEVQKALVALLKADGAIAALVGTRVYDPAPQNPTYPFISFGPKYGSPWDTDTDLGWELSMQIDCWSRKIGVAECGQIVAAVKAAVHRAVLSLDTQTPCICLADTQTILEDPDGLTRHGVLRVHVITYE